MVERKALTAALPTLQRRLHDLRRAAADNDYSTFFAVDYELHRTMIRAAGTPELEHCWQHVFKHHVEGMQRILRHMWPNLMDLYREHELLLTAWQSHDVWVVEQATVEHIRAGWYRLLATQGGNEGEVSPVERAAAFMSIHYGEKLDMGWIARHVSFISAVQLTRLFRRKHDLSPHQYLKRIRLERAAHLLNTTNLAVAGIAARVGYQNPSHFIRDFRERFDLTPKNYRRAHHAS